MRAGFKPNCSANSSVQGSKMSLFTGTFRRTPQSKQLFLKKTQEQPTGKMYPLCDFS